MQSGRCVEGCFAGALELIGKQLAVDQVMADILPDLPFFESSGGGVTVSGGEPLIQWGFTYNLLIRCKEEKIHTAIETSAYCRWNTLAYLLPVTNLIMMDIKHMDSDKHRIATGVSNHRILENARKLAQSEIPMIIHTPIVPNFNDTPQEIGEIAKFIRSLVAIRSKNDNVQADISLVLLPFHRLATDKYQSLEVDYRAKEVVAPSREKMDYLIGVAREYRINVK
jgi:pyruvate formate lyase activating enzyme